MTAVETVSGPVEADQLGTTLVHEHCRFRDESVAHQWPGFYDAESELAAALAAVRAAADRGVETICDPTAMFGGRDVRFLARVADETAVRIVACTGIYTYDFLPHYFEHRSADQIAEHFVHDIEQGIQGTAAKAAFLKCAADAAGVTANVEKVHRAVARASVRTGAPIMAHSCPAAATGPRQVEIFREEGVDLARVQIAHTGDTDDLDYIERLLDAGVFVGLDRYGLEMFLAIERRNATAAELLRRGYATQMMISQDHCATIDWFTPGGDRRARRAGRRARLEHDTGLRPGAPDAARAGRAHRRARGDDLRRQPEALAGRLRRPAARAVALRAGVHDLSARPGAKPRPGACRRDIPGTLDIATGPGDRRPPAIG